MQADPRPMDEAFRTTLCAGCGGFVKAAAGDERARCAACGREVVLPARPPRRAPPAPFAQDARLLGQPATLLSTGPELAALWEGERSIPSTRSAEAEEAFRARRARLERGDATAETDLVVLARELSLRALARDDAALARAILECALDVVSSAVARACLNGALIRACLRVGEIDAARARLGDLPVHAGDLLEDTELRIGAAALACASADAATVLAWLGESEDEITSHPMLGWLASLLRAHAFERLGRADAARAELEDLLDRRPSALAAVDHNLPRLPYLAGLSSWSGVRRAFLERTHRTSDLMAEGRVVIAIAFLLLAGFSLFAYYQHATRDHLLFAIGLAVILPILATGIRLAYLGRGLRHAFVHGRPVRATITGLEPGLYGRGRHNRLTAVRLESEIDGVRTTSADHRFLDPRERVRYHRGAEVLAFVDPERPRHAVITTPPP